VNKTYANVQEGVADIMDGAVIAVGGFFTAGTPRLLLRGLINKGVSNLTMVCGCGPLLGAREELSLLVKKGQITKVIDSYPLARSIGRGRQDPFEKKVRSGEIELEIYPMGTIAEKLRAAGAGIGAFYVPTGIGTPVEEVTVTNKPPNVLRKETKIIDDRVHILEYALKPDFGLIHAHRADIEGNLIYRKTARNFNPVVAMAAKTTVVEVEELVDPGGIDSDSIHTPGIYIDRIVQVPGGPE